MWKYLSVFQRDALLCFWRCAVGSCEASDHINSSIAAEGPNQELEVHGAQAGDANEVASGSNVRQKG